MSPSCEQRGMTIVFKDKDTHAEDDPGIKLLGTQLLSVSYSHTECWKLVSGCLSRRRRVASYALGSRRLWVTGSGRQGAPHLGCCWTMDSCWKLVEATIGAALRGGEPSMHIMLPWVNFNITVMIIAIIAMVFCEE